MSDGVGWGAGGWGSSPWGGDSAGDLAIVSAVAAAENIVQVEFTRPVYLTGVFDTFDAADPDAWSIAPVAGSVGWDGSSARPVTVVGVAILSVPGFLDGQILSLTLDRSLTAYPSSYVVSADPAVIVSDDMTVSLDSSQASASFFGAQREIVIPTIESPVVSRDAANPPTLSGARAAGLPVPVDPAILGTIPVDDTGDYALVSGAASFTQRLYRRIVTVPGGFLHLGQGYGLGVTSYGKKLALAAVRGQLEASGEQQIQREPEVARVRCRATTTTSGILRFAAAVKLRSGQTATYALNFPMSQ